MNIEEIRNICLSLKGVEESIKWESHLCFTDRSSRVSLNVYNFLGNIVAHIFVGDVEAGVVNTVEFNVNEMHNEMCYVRMSSGSESVDQKFVKH